MILPWFLCCRAEQKEKKDSGEKSDALYTSRLHKEFLKPAYAASICDDWEDGLFDGETEA